jgi:integrase
VRNHVVRIDSALRAYLETYARRSVVGDWYFPSFYVGRWNSENVTNRLAEVNQTHVDDAGKPAPLPWNCKIVRHTYASQLAHNGASLFEIAKLMGNSHQVCDMICSGERHIPRIAFIENLLSLTGRKDSQ